MPVSAMVRQLDDHALVMAQGQENNARQDLSFIEKASFAVQLQQLDYDRPTIAAALSMELPMVSRMLKAGVAFDIRTTAKGVTLNIAGKRVDGFDTWINANAETLLADLHDRWTKTRTED